MEHTKFSTRIPVDLHELLEAEASNESRSINQQLIAILKERYNAHAPPIGRNHSPTSRMLPRITRKAKAKAEAS